MRFAKFILLWLVICVVAACSLEFAYRHYTTLADSLFTKYQRKAGTVEQVYIGNSHVGVFTALHDEDVRVANMSLGGQDIFRMYTVIKTLIPQSPALKTIYMGLDYDLIGYNQSKSGEEYLDRVYFPYTGEMYNDNFTNRLMSKSSFFRSNRDMAYLFSKKPKEKTINFIPVNSAPVEPAAPVAVDTTKHATATNAEVATPAPPKKMDPRMCRKRAEEHTLLKYKEKYIAENLGYLKQIVDLCNQHNIKLILFNPPKTECYKSSSNQKNITAAKLLIDSFTTSNNAIYLDFYNSPDFNDAFFVDFDHLNTEGTSILDKKLISYH